MQYDPVMPQHHDTLAMGLKDDRKDILEKTGVHGDKALEVPDIQKDPMSLHFNPLTTGLKDKSEGKDVENRMSKTSVGKQGLQIQPEQQQQQQLQSQLQQQQPQQNRADFQFPIREYFVADPMLQNRMNPVPVPRSVQ